MAAPKTRPPELEQLWSWYLASPSNFLFGNDKVRGLVLTMDEHALPTENPLKELPRRPHLELLADLLSNEQQVAIAKSRQMMISWLCLSMVLFESMHPGRRWGISCKKFEAADELLDRLWGMYQRLPEGLKPKAIRKQGLVTIQHPNAPSQIHAFSQDSDEARSKTFSGILVDEAAFCDHLDDLLAACKPTVMGGGKLWLVSTPNFLERFAEVLSDSGRVDL